MGLVLLDSSVLIALLNPRDIHHQKALDSNAPTHRYIISTISIPEVMAHAIKEGIADRIWRALDSLIYQMVDIDRQIATDAAHLRVSSGLKTPDAIISACATQAKAQLWTFDAKLAKATPGARLLA